MYRILKKYRCGNTFKYVSLPLKQDSDFDNNYYKKNVNNDKILCNLIRAKTKVKELILCNDFKYFFTLTCNNKKINRYNLDEFRSYITRRIRYYRSKYGLNFKYIFIPEKHKNGGWHLHGVLNMDFAPYIDINIHGYDELLIFTDIGYNSIEEIKDLNKVSSYITKYLTKDFATREKGSHLYFASKGLNRPILEDVKLYNNSFFDGIFWPIKNDYCYVNYSSFSIDKLLK